MIGQEHVRSAGSAATPAFRPPEGSPSVHLDALRGFAAFSVLLFHWRAHLIDVSSQFHQQPLLRAAYAICGLGHQWVIVFFVLSGYLVGGSVLRLVASGQWSWRGYLLSRLTRLYIVLLPALLLGGALDWAGLHLVGKEAVCAAMAPHIKDVEADLTLPILAANSLFLQTIKLPGIHDKIRVFGSNGPLWSLSNEFWYYLAFPLLVLLLAKGRSWRVRVACGLGLAAWGWFVGSGIALLGNPWLMGALIAFLPPFPAHGPWTRGPAIVAALALLGGGLLLGYRGRSHRTDDLVLGLIVTLLIWVTLNCATAPLPSFYVKIAQRSARSSYTLYLTHLPLLIFLKASLHLPLAIPSWHLFLVSVALLAVILLYAQLVYELFEKRTDRLRNWIRPYVMRGKAA
jgi:peptidoglycan/LPS O-acetylase OafA/YrhL